MNSCSQFLRPPSLDVFLALLRNKNHSIVAKLFEMKMHFLRWWLSSRRRVRNPEKCAFTGYNGFQSTENRYVSFFQFAAKKKQMRLLTNLRLSKARPVTLGQTSNLIRIDQHVLSICVCSVESNVDLIVNLIHSV